MANETIIVDLLNELKQSFGELFVAMNEAQQISLDDSKQSVAIATSHNADVAHRMQIIDSRMKIFLKELENWPLERRNLSPALVEDVEHFTGTLEQGLHAMKDRLGDHILTLHEEQKRLAESIRGLQKNRLGMRGYKSADHAAQLFNKKA